MNSGDRLGPLNFGDVAGDVTIEAGGDIIAGNKIIVHQIVSAAIRPANTKAPYKFLAYYNIVDRDLFFGRKDDITQIVQLLVSHELVFLSGPSGCGKTSLVNAGLIPAVSEKDYFFVAFRDYEQPASILRKILAPNLHFTLRSVQGPDLIASRQASRLVLIFDQFERFIVSAPAEERREFVALLAEQLKTRAAKILITVREDFLGPLLSEFQSPYPDALQQRGLYVLRPLEDRAAREAIIQPIKSIPKIGYDVVFVDRVLIPDLMKSTSVGDAVQAVQLQIVCNQLYTQALEQLASSNDEQSVNIGNELYSAAGGVEGILRNYLNQAMTRAIPEADTADARGVLKTMVGSSGTRRFLTVAEISVQLSDLEKSKVQSIVYHLLEARLVEQRQSEGHPDTRYAPSSEYLVPEIRSWYDERELQKKRSRETLERGLEEYRSNSSLLNRRQVDLIRAWLAASELKPEERELLDKSEAWVSRQEREEAERSALLASRKKLIMRLAITVGAVSLCFGAGAGYEAIDAKRQAIRAELQVRLARSNLFAQAAKDSANESPETAVLYAAEAVRLADGDIGQTSRASERLRAALERVSGSALRGYDHFQDGVDSMSYSHIEKIATSRGGALIAAGSNGGQVYVWSLGKDRTTHLVKFFSSAPTEWKKYFMPMYSPIEDVRFAFADRWLVIRDRSGKTTAFDVTKGFSEIVLDPTWDNARLVAASPDGQTIATLSLDEQAVILWRLEKDSKPVSYYRFNVSKPVLDLKFSADGGRILIIYSASNFSLLNVRTGQHVRDLALSSPSSYLGKSEAEEIESNKDDVSGLSSPDGKYLVVSAKLFTDFWQPRKVASIWDVSKDIPVMLRLYPNREDFISDAQFSRDGAWLAVRHNAVVELWDLRKTSPEKEATFKFKEDAGEVSFFSFDSASKRLLVQPNSRPPKIYDLSASVPSVLSQAILNGNDPRISEDGRFALTTDDESNSLHVCDISSGCQPVEGAGARLKNAAGCKGRTGIWMTSISADNVLRVSYQDESSSKSAVTDSAWASPEEAALEPKFNEAICSDDGRWMFSRGGAGKSRLFDISGSDPEVAAVPLGNLALGSQAYFAPKSRWLFIRADKQLTAISLTNNPPRANLISDFQGGELTFSPDGQWMLESPGSSYLSREQKSVILRSLSGSEVERSNRLSTNKITALDGAFGNSRSTLFLSENTESYDSKDFEKQKPPVKALLLDLSGQRKNTPAVLNGHMGNAGVEFSPTDAWFATTDQVFEQRKKTAQLWKSSELDHPALRWEVDAPAQVLFPMFDPQNRWFILGEGRGAEFYSLAKIERNAYRTKNPEPDFAIESGTRVSAYWSLVFSRDGHWMVNYGRNEPLRIWWMKSGDVPKLVGEGGETTDGASAKFTSDSRQLITSQPGGADVSTSFWTLDPESGSVSRSSVQGGGPILLDPDERRVTILTEDGPRSHFLNEQELVSSAERAVNRNMTLGEWKKVLPSVQYARTFDDLPYDVSYLQDLVESAYADLSAGRKQEGRKKMELAANNAIQTQNPFATARVARAALLLGMPDLAIAPSEATVRALPNDPTARRLRGRAKAQVGDSAGAEDLQAYVAWGRLRGLSRDALEWEQDAIHDISQGMKAADEPGDM